MYSGTIEKIAAHFDVEEFSSMKNQIKELKLKKGYYKYSPTINFLPRENTLFYFKP